MTNDKKELIQKCNEIEEGFTLLGTLCVAAVKFVAFLKKVIKEDENDGGLQKDIGSNKEHR